MALRETQKLTFHRGHRRTVDPLTEPVSITEIKTHLRLTDPDSDELLYLNELLLEAVREIEDASGMAFNTQTWKLSLDRWPTVREQWWDGEVEAHVDVIYSGARFGVVTLPRYPLQTVSTVTVYDEDGNATAVTVADVFDVDAQAMPGRMTLKQGATWPVAMRSNNAIEIVYKAGWGDTAQEVPSALRRAVRQMVAYIYEHRGDGCDPKDAYRMSGAAAILDRYRIVKV